MTVGFLFKTLTVMRPSLYDCLSKTHPSHISVIRPVTSSVANKKTTSFKPMPLFHHILLLLVYFRGGGGIYINIILIIYYLG